MTNAIDEIESYASFNSNILRAQLALSTIKHLRYQYNKRELVYQHDKVKLYHYHSKKPYNKPLLVVFATVNRPEILDLFPDHSLIGHLLKEHSDVYLLDWGYPNAEDQNISLNDYVQKYLKGCVQFICQHTKQTSIDLLGICQGGLICLLYSLLQNDIHKMVLISCPIDFHTQDNVISHLFRKLDVDLLTHTFGNIPGLWLTNFFISMRPFELVGKKYLKFVDNIQSEIKTNEFLQVEKWLYDAPDQTATSFSELIKDFYQNNKLISNDYRLNGKRISLSNLKIPVLNIMAKHDEIVPMSASSCLKEYVPAHLYTEQFFDSGHIGIYISSKVGRLMPKAIAEWLRKTT